MSNPPEHHERARAEVESALDPQAEAEAWVDWVGSGKASQLDERTRALVHAAFAAGFQAGWRRERQTPAKPKVGV